MNLNLQWLPADAQRVFNTCLAVADANGVFDPNEIVQNYRGGEDNFYWITTLARLGAFAPESETSLKMKIVGGRA